jgi:hypothetical protein
VISFSTLVAHSLLYGAILSALLSILIVVTLLFRPMIWINDAPSELRTAAGPISAADRRFQRLAGALLLTLLAVFPVIAVVTLPGGGSPTFAEAALSAFIVLMTFNTVDLVLLDWLFVERLAAGRISFPNAPGMNFTMGDAHHFRGFLIGTGLSLAAAIVIATIVTLLYQA